MMANEKMTKAEVAAMLMEALEQFCDERYKDLRPALAHPFRQKDGDGQFFPVTGKAVNTKCRHCILARTE